MTHPAKRRIRHIRHLVIWAMLGALMFLSKLLLDGLPNIHMVGTLLMVYTLVYRWGALVPLYVFVALSGFYAGFNPWWYPYIYIWTILWAVTMLLPKKMPTAVASIVYPLVCCLHGLGFGILYAPMQALLYGFDFEQMIAWIMTGVTFDIIHAIGNFAGGLLILPMVKLLKKIESYTL